MSRLSRAFEKCAGEGRAALVIYLTAGHPSPEVTPEVLEALAESGADVIELGVPFSDPLADGPVIQKSSFQAIQQGATPAWVLETLARFRERRETPVVLFTYLNPILRYQASRFLEQAATAGADGVLVTDLPLGADPGLEESFAGHGLDLIRLVAPTTPPERARMIAAATRGFLYYLARTGVTGAPTELSVRLAAEVNRLREASPAPVAVGFGIATPEQARAAARAADGVVVGSAVVERLGSGGVEEARRFVSELAAAVKQEPTEAFDTPFRYR
ncbi:MAG: tryptophan synthase subunit alpha [Longimicrobiaceae bacterium]